MTTTNDYEDLTVSKAKLTHLLVYGTVKPVLSDHIKQDIFLAFQTGGCLLLYESSSSALLYSAVSSYLSIAISMSPEWMVA